MGTKFNKRHLHFMLSTYLALIVAFSMMFNQPINAFASVLDDLQKYSSSTTTNSLNSWFAKTDDQTEYTILKGKSFTSWLSGSKTNSDLKAKAIYVPNQYKKYINVTLDKNSGNFTVKGLSAGKGSFVVYSSKKSVYITVTVNEIHTTFISITPTEYPNNSTQGKLILKIGEISLLRTVLSPSNSTDTIIWSSSNKSVATVSTNGVIKAIGAGTATITAVTENGKTAKYTVQVLKPVTTTTKATTTKATTTTKKTTTTTTKATTTTTKVTTTTKKTTTTTTKVTTHQVKILANSLHVRTGKGTSYKTLTYVSKGGIYTYTKYENGWYYIKVGNMYGWVYANGGSYVQKIS